MQTPDNSSNPIIFKTYRRQKSSWKLSSVYTVASIMVVITIIYLCAFPTISILTGIFSNQAFADQTQITNPDAMGKFQDNPDYKDRQANYNSLKAQNPHTVGWIYIEGTKVDNVIMQNIENKDFYIDKGFDKEYYFPGTLYISNISDLIKPTDVINMYGHNMKDRTMFGSLREYLKPEFLKEHNQIIIDTMEKRREYQITHVMRIRVNVPDGDKFPYYTYADFDSEEDYNEFINQCNEHSLYDSGNTTAFGDKLVMLTTCEYTYSDGTGRLVIMGKEIEPEPPVVAANPASPVQQDLPLTTILIMIASLIIFLIVSLVTNRR